MTYTYLYEREPLFTDNDIDGFLGAVELDADIRDIPFDLEKTQQLIRDLTAQLSDGTPTAIGFFATYPTYGHYDALGREIDVTLEISVSS